MTDVINQVAAGNLAHVIGTIFPMFWLFTLIGVATAGLLERKTIYGILKRKVEMKCSNQAFCFLMHRLAYVIGGLALMSLAYAIPAAIYGLVAKPLDGLDLSVVGPVTDGISFIKVMVSCGGVITSGLLLMAAAALTASAGTRWLVNTAKIFVTLALVSPFVFMTIASILSAA